MDDPPGRCVYRRSGGGGAFLARAPVDGVTEFFQMGGYAAYVWSSYALALGALALNIVWARRNLRTARAEARRRIEMETHP